MPLTRIAGLLLKPEPVTGTDSVPVAATDGIELEQTFWSTIKVSFLEKNERDQVPGRLGYNKGPLPTGGLAEMEVKVALKGAGVVYAPLVRPEIDVLLRAASFAAVDLTGTVGSEKWGYRLIVDPIATAMESATAYVYAAGLLYKVIGVRAVLTEISLIPGRIVVGTFKLTGMLPANPTETALPAIIYPRKTVKPPAWAGSSVTLNGIGQSASSATLKTGSVQVTKARGNATGGHGGYEITNQKPTLAMQIDRPTLAAFNPWLLQRAMTEIPWNVGWGTAGAGSYNRVVLQGTTAVIDTIDNDEKDDLAMVGMTLRLQNAEVAPIEPMEITFS